MDTDSKVFQELTAALGSIHFLHSGRLNVQVQNGIATIAGRVNTFAQRKVVERVARRVAGTRTLIFEIGAAVTPRGQSGERANSTEST